MAVTDFLPTAAEGAGLAGVFLYLMRTVLQSDRPLSRGIREIQSRLDAERKRGDEQDSEIARLQDDLRRERDKSATAEAGLTQLRAELTYANDRVVSLTTENAGLYAELTRLRGGVA